MKKVLIPLIALIVFSIGVALFIVQKPTASNNNQTQSTDKASSPTGAK